jgi:hypothetical protein
MLTGGGVILLRPCKSGVVTSLPTLGERKSVALRGAQVKAQNRWSYCCAWSQLPDAGCLTRCVDKDVQRALMQSLNDSGALMCIEDYFSD